MDMDMNPGLNLTKKSDTKNKVALCFIISYNHILNKEEIWKKWIEPNQDWINVYVHYKQLNKIKSPWLRSHTLPPAFISPTTYLHVVPAYISVFSYAHHHDITNTWFCTLTDACVPLVSPTEFKARFQQYSDKSIMRYQHANWNPAFHSRANLKYLPESMHVMHDPWFTLTRVHVKQIINYIFHPATRHIYNIICKGGLANESIFAIMLGLYNGNSGNSGNNVLNTSSTIADWSRPDGPTRPHTFCAIDNPQLNRYIIQKLKDQNPLAMFLRKVAVQ